MGDDPRSFGSQLVPRKRLYSSGEGSLAELSCLLRVRVPPHIQVYVDSNLRQPLIADDCFAPLKLDDAFLKIMKMNTKNATDTIARLLDAERAYSRMYQADRVTVADQSEFPGELISAYKKGNWGCLHEIDPSVRTFGPWGMLTLLPGGFDVDTKNILIPTEGVKFDTALQLAETFCFLVSLAEKRPNDDEQDCSIELVRAVRNDFIRQLRHRLTVSYEFPSLREAWDRSRESRVAYTHHFFDTLAQIVEAFYILANASPNTHKAWIRHRGLRQPKEVEICEFRLPSQRNSQLSTLCNRLGTVITDSLNRFKNDPGMKLVRKSTYAHNSQQSGTSHDGKGKKKETAAPRQSNDGKLGFYVDLLQTVSGSAMKAGALLRARSADKPLRVTVNGNEERNVCLRAMSSKLEGCSHKSACKFYHFPKDVSGPPTGVDLQDLIAFLQEPAVKKKVVPTELGTKVLGPL